MRHLPRTYLYGERRDGHLFVRLRLYIAIRTDVYEMRWVLFMNFLLFSCAKTSNCLSLGFLVFHIPHK